MEPTIEQQDVSDWDSPVLDIIIKDWVELIKEGIMMNSLFFPRSTVSRRAIKKPRMLGFWDGSSQAFAGAVYVVSMVAKDEDYYEEDLQDRDLLDYNFNEEVHKFEVHLLAAKA